jgi:hypothetical protein
MTPCTPTDLIASTKCFACLSEKQILAIIAYLSCQIASGGTGGSQELYEGSGDPGALIPDDPTKPAQYTNLNDSVQWTWDAGAQNWI